MQNAYVAWKVVISNGEDWMKWACNCPTFMKKYLCKYVVLVTLWLKYVNAPTRKQFLLAVNERGADQLKLNQFLMTFFYVNQDHFPSEDYFLEDQD